MNAPSKIAFIGNSLPRRCGIATFTTDLQQAVAELDECQTSIIAMNDRGARYNYPTVVRWQISDDRIEDYIHAAEALNSSQVDIVCLQHEFGIFGGEAGSNILALLTRLTMPVVTTLHTVLSEPAPAQRAVMDQILEISAKVVVMAEKGADLLRSVYRVPSRKIEVIPHGIPDFAFIDPDEAKAKVGFTGRTVILTFGLLSPNKGIGVMIDAMPTILQSRPNAVYVVLGATHPNLLRDHGEAYRESLVARVDKLGIQDHVVFLDQFVDQATLLNLISMCDVYVTPYLSEAQMTSGTLAYSFGLGKAVVSTPYWHARELLDDGRGILIPFGDSLATGSAIARLLSDEPRRQTMRQRAYKTSRSMTWRHTAERYLEVFESARRYKLAAVERIGNFAPDAERTPEMEIGYFLSMCDDTGLFQHATYSVPDRSHGYCLDDNARALLLACALNADGEERLDDELTAELASFVQHAWNPSNKRFRNFMGFDRNWLEEQGSEDSHGRALWALGACARSDFSGSRRAWSSSLFHEAMEDVPNFSSPRAWAFVLLGLDGYCRAVPQDSAAREMRKLLADRLMSRLATSATDDWIWFEDSLSYDNARLSQALIVTGSSTQNPGYTAAGLRTLRWLVQLQLPPSGIFRPVGTESFGALRLPPKAFDQQPVEASAMISACLAAWRADGDQIWKRDAARIFGWFLGRNDLSVPLVDRHTGSCRDGLHRDRANENRGGESVVSYLLSLSEIREIDRRDEERAQFIPHLVQKHRLPESSTKH